MSGVLSLAGSAAGLITIALAQVIGRHYHHLPGSAHPVAERLIIVLMYAGGSAVAVTRLGQWAASAIRWAAGLAGGLSSGLPRAALVIACLAVLASLLASLAVAPTPRAGILAAVMPLALSLAAGGILQQVYVATTVPARELAGALSSWLGG